MRTFLIYTIYATLFILLSALMSGCSTPTKCTYPKLAAIDKIPPHRRAESVILAKKLRVVERYYGDMIEGYTKVTNDL